MTNAVDELTPFWIGKNNDGDDGVDDSVVDVSVLEEKEEEEEEG